jgi:hypothetical protein
MAKHTKPTPEELEAGIKKAQEDIAKLDNVDETKDEQSTEENTTKTSEETSQETENEDTKVREGSEDDTEETKEDAQDEQEDNKEDTEEKVDYKKKFVYSTRESQVLHSKNKKISDAIEKAVTMPDPTEDELKTQFPNWDVMSETEQVLAKKTFKYDKAFSMLSEVTKESKDIEAWNKKVDEYTGDPKTLIAHPELEGKTEEFQIFASKPTRRGVDFEDLIKAFLFDVAAKQVKSKGKMFDTGSGGEKPKPKSDVLSATEGRKLMKSDYKKWKELLIAGKIANE